MKAVHFGAGNIGRGFIGPVLSKSGYKVTFVARNKKKVEELRERRQYPVILANENLDSFMVDNVTAVSLGDSNKVVKAVSEAEIVTTAVGINALKDIAETIAKGITLRLKQHQARKPLHIIACENGIGASQVLKKWVYRHLKPSAAAQADLHIAFPNAVVDRIVPVQKHQDHLQVMVEPFCEWVIDQNQIKGDSPPIQGVRFADSLDPYLERKLFTVNTGHCCAAYFGYLKGCATIQDAMSDPDIQASVRGALQETGALLIRKHGFDPSKHNQYIEKILGRFSNPHFNDQVTRVARSPLRKLSPEERLVYPAMKAYEFGLETKYLVAAIASALRFEYSKDPEAVKLQESIRKQGIEQVVTDELGIPADHPLFDQVISRYNKTAKVVSG
ncbi:mannitol-1-phosphate 5-dehydrogenase [Paenibacillus caui]|uniref:mannitol-1-phosphate 5-dehydrogenase n=1 Tax=Paenibacillus caui TaxID=2873927 RepID=UPI001CA8E8FD|nr:mannitol-1-phosphate 5-dehydrogenase [Paenibacillus caui]